MPKDLKVSQIGSSLLPPPFRGLHSPGVRKHCQIIFVCYIRKSSIDWKCNYCECWCYIIRIKWCFQWLLLHVLVICCKQSDKSHSVHGCLFLVVIFRRFFQCVMSVSWNQPQPGCWNYLYEIFIYSCTYTTFQIKTVFNNVLFSDRHWYSLYDRRH